MLKVWDAAVRLLHWTLVVAVAAAALSIWQFGRLHQPAGYVALAAVLLRLLWGTVGARGRLQAGGADDRSAGFARFDGFVRGPRKTLAYLAQVLHRREPRYVGHNPLGGWMVLALLFCVAGLAASGWLYTSDAFWGDATAETVHRALAWVLLALVVLHVAGVAFTSWRHRENLLVAMFTGRKRRAAPGDIA